jgi:carboxypeptidase family protein
MRGRFEKARAGGFFAFVICLCLCPLGHEASAQTAAGILGQVRDESGGVLPGVTVTAESPALQVKAVSDVTNAQGEYRLTPLPIGTYVVTYTLSGFQTIRQQALRLEIGMQVKMDVVMKVGTIAETVTVSGAAPVVDVTSSASSTQLTRETLELTPTARNGLISLGAQAPGVYGVIDYGGGSVGTPPEFRTFGQTYEAGIIVEGIQTSDPRNSAMGGNYFDYNAMDEARVQSINNAPDVYSHGVAITMLVKSGGNDFHGDAEFSDSGSSLASNNLDAKLRAQGITAGNPLNYRRDFGGDLGGRIVRDKLWFYGAMRYRPQDILLLGAFQPNGTQADAYRGETIANEKLSYQMSSGNKLVFWGQWSQKYHYGDNVTPFVAWSARTDRKPPVRTNIWKTEWQAVKGNSLVLSALFGRWNWSGGTNIATIGSTAANLAAGVPQGLAITTLTDASHGGGEPSSFDQVTLNQAGTATGGGSWTNIWKWDYKATLSWFKPDLFLGNHDFKAGFDDAPYRYIQGNGDRGPAGQYQEIFRTGTPFEVALYNYPQIPENDTHYVSSYVSDSWTIARRLTLDLGLRQELDAGGVPAQCRLAGAWSFDPAACVAKTSFKTFDSFAPRLYFSYDVTGNAKTVVKGGWGRFYRQTLVDDLNVINPFQAITNIYRWNNPGNRVPGPCAAPQFTGCSIAFDPSQIGAFVSTNAPINGVNNPNMLQAGTDQLSLSLERQLGRNFGIRASGVFIRTFNMPRFLDILRPPSAYTIPIANPNPAAPGTTITYWDYPAAFAGSNFEKYEISNDPTLAERHETVDFQVTKRLANRWQLIASFTATKNHTPLPGPDFGRAIPFWTPNFLNVANNTWDDLFRASGIYLLPAGVSVSANFNDQRGNAQAPQAVLTGGQQIASITVNALPLGSIRLPTVRVLDLRFEKSIRLGRNKLSVVMNLYNALNTNAITARNLIEGASYLKPTAIVQPRILAFGTSYTF